MEKIKLILIMMSMANAGCSSEQISVIKFKGGNDCSKADIAEIPINSTAASNSSLLDDFTFCGKYYFRFLKSNTLLMSIEPVVFLGIKNIVV